MVGADSRRRSANVFSGLGRHAGRAFLRAPRPRIAIAGLRADALVACRRRDETHRAYPYRVGCARHFDAARNWRSAALAALYGATYQLEPAHGHNVLMGKRARAIAEAVIPWGELKPVRHRRNEASRRR